MCCRQASSAFATTVCWAIVSVDRSGNAAANFWVCHCRNQHRRKGSERKTTATAISDLQVPPCDNVLSATTVKCCWSTLLPLWPQSRQSRTLHDHRRHAKSTG